MKTLLRAAVVAAIGIYAALVAPPAGATPGQCIQSPFGGFCDSTAAPDGSFQHCENSGFGWFSYSNCYQACLDGGGRPYPTDLNLDTPC